MIPESGLSGFRIKIMVKRNLPAPGLHDLRQRTKFKGVPTPIQRMPRWPSAGCYMGCGKRWGRAWRS